VEHKKIEFGQANYGIALIESFYPLYNTMLSDSISLETFVNALTYKPCAILGLKSITIEEGSPAVVTLFSEKGKPSVSPNFTKAYNTPCIQE